MDPNFSEAVLRVAHNKPLGQSSVGFTFQRAFLGSTMMGSVENKNAFLLLRCLENSHLRVWRSLSLKKTKHMKRVTRSILITVYLPLQPGAPWYLDEAHRGQVAWGCCGQWTFAVLHIPLPLPPATTWASSGDSILLQLRKQGSTLRAEECVWGQAKRHVTLPCPLRFVEW